LDERQKTKARAQSLWSFIGKDICFWALTVPFDVGLTVLYADATNNFDQARFFQENAEQVFQVISETCMNQIEKIKRRCLWFGADIDLLYMKWNWSTMYRKNGSTNELEFKGIN
jgi:hypothetical protein